VNVNRLDFDLRKIREMKDIQALDKYFKTIGSERFNAAWQELEKNKIDAATTAILYCGNWQEFCVLTEAYGVSKEQSPELNQQFRLQLKEKGLDKLVANWYTEVAA